MIIIITGEKLAEENYKVPQDTENLYIRNWHKYNLVSQWHSNKDQLSNYKQA